MAALYLLYFVIMLLILGNQRRPAAILIASGIVLCFLMLWHHATDLLKINW